MKSFLSTEYKIKISNWEYIAFFVIFLFAAQASKEFSAMLWYSQNPLMFAIPVVTLIILSVTKQVRFNNVRFLFSLLIISVWYIGQYLITKTYNMSYIFFLYYNLITAFILIKAYNEKLFVLYEDVTTKLSFIAIFGWLLSLLAHDVMYNLALKFHAQTPIAVSMYLFSVSDNANSEILLRNSGFCWEPGRFACFVVLAVFFNLARTNFKIKGNKNLIILLIALLSSQSTTGYSAFIVCLVMFLYNKNSKKILLYSLVLLPLVFIFFNLPFMKKKIFDNYSNEDKIYETEKSMDYHNSQDDEKSADLYVPQRFEGLYYQWLNVTHEPILFGYGRELKNFYTQKYLKYNIFSSEGNLEVLVKYGAFMAFLYYLLLYRSSKYISKYFRFKGSFLFMLLFIVISFSYSFLLVPVFMSLWSYSYFHEEKRRVYLSKQ